VTHEGPLLAFFLTDKSFFETFDFIFPLALLSPSVSFDGQLEVMGILLKSVKEIEIA
jgi:hypothetical protein